MSQLRLDTLRLPVTDLGADNPLPLLQPLERLERPSTPTADAAIPAGMADRLEYGRVISGYPYTCQDGYGRDLAERELRVAVLENDHLRALFLLDYGGRLWSLRDRATGRELLWNPGKIQLANLGLRNAWFAGGVEWNLGAAAHSPFTCAPLHAAIARGPRNEPCLRLYEYERLRGVVFQLDAWLPEDSRFLKIHVRVHNPGPETVPMWWWSNAAVSEAPDVRVLAPTDRAWGYKYGGDGLRQTPLPFHDGEDVTYPGRAADAAEYFFRLSPKRPPWVAALDQHGVGLVQLSTRRLLGRKVFRWGTGPGGRRWQGWLGEADSPYLEIQGGITETQMEHVAFRGGETWSWLEAYGPVQVDPSHVHGPWSEAQAAVDEALSHAGAFHLEAELDDAFDAVQQPPQQQLVTGSGWGALEQLRRKATGENPILLDAGAPFPTESLGADQQPWVDVLAGADQSTLTEEPPPHGVKGLDWARRLAQLEPGWLTTYLQGSLAHAEHDLPGARRLYETALRHRENPWALRGLALLDLQAGDIEAAADRYAAAHRLWPDSPHLAVEAAESLLEAGRANDALSMIRGLPPPARTRGRLRMLEARALVESGEPAEARALLDTGIEVADLREGERGLDALWCSLYPDVQVPPEYDFRMRTLEGEHASG